MTSPLAAIDEQLGDTDPLRRLQLVQESWTRSRTGRWPMVTAETSKKARSGLEDRLNTGRSVRYVVSQGLG